MPPDDMPADKMLPDDLLPIEQIEDEDGDEPYQFAAMAREATEFLLSQSWCVAIRRGFLDIAWTGILGVFYFEFDPVEGVPDESTWVVVGDLPSAYMCNDNPNGASALASYVWEMRKWVRAAKNGDPVDDLIPVNVPPTLEYADLLERRLDFIERELLPQHKDDISAKPLED